MQFVAVSRTFLLPAVLNVRVTFLVVKSVGGSPWKSYQCHAVGLLVDRSESVTVCPT